MAMDAMMAGIDTTGNSGAFLFYLIGLNPDKQELVYQEIKNKLGDKDLTPSILNELKYVKATIYETIRLRPAVGGYGRVIQRDMVLSGYLVPKGKEYVI